MIDQKRRKVWRILYKWKKVIIPCFSSLVVLSRCRAEWEPERNGFVAFFFVSTRILLFFYIRSHASSHPEEGPLLQPRPFLSCWAISELVDVNLVVLALVSSRLPMLANISLMHLGRPSFADEKCTYNWDKMTGTEKQYSGDLGLGYSGTMGLLLWLYKSAFTYKCRCWSVGKEEKWLVVCSISPTYFLPYSASTAGRTGRGWDHPPHWPPSPVLSNLRVHRYMSQLTICPQTPYNS